jgi:dienelactone hydrolase
VTSSCAGVSTGWRSLRVGHIHAAELGTGPAVVFGNDSGNSACDWLPLAGDLAAHRFRAVIFDYDDFSEAHSARDMIALGRAAGGAHRYALVGASLGGRLVIEGAARDPAGLAAIVSLSGERMLPSYPDILPQARKVNVATLYVGTTADSYTDGVIQQQQLHRAIQGQPNDLIQLVGVAHGTETLDLTAADGVSIRAHIRAFLTAQLS